MVNCFAEVAKKHSISERQAQMIWHRGQVGVGKDKDKPGDKGAPEYFTIDGLTTTGEVIFKAVETARLKHIDERFGKMEETMQNTEE